MTETLARQGKATPAEDQAIASFVNIATGRADLGRYEASAVNLATVFFSPKYTVSRFQLLTGALTRTSLKSDNRAKKMVAKEYARALTGMGLLYLMVAMVRELWPDDDEENRPEVSIDATSSEFGKIRFGDRRLDPLFGLSQTAVFMTRLEESMRSNIVGWMGGREFYKGKRAPQAVWDFQRGKFAPVVSAALNLAAGENMVGEDVTPGSVAWDSSTPMAYNDIYKVMKEEGMPTNIALSLLTFWGMGLQTYHKKPAKGRRFKKK